LGIVRADGRIAYVGPGFGIDEDFVASARSGRAPEKRFRFAQPCAETGCVHWEADRCGVIDAAVDAEIARTPEAAVDPLPRCGIRAQCRWFGQWGARACAVCPAVVTDVSGAAANEKASAPRAFPMERL
jgi:hypothetical protein